MQSKGKSDGPSKSGPHRDMTVTDDEIREKYLERAIREINSLTHDLHACEGCPRGNLMPVIGSGHPQADVFLLKHAATVSEIEEGVAFYGRAGAALMKSLKRLDIDPLAIYGTLCVKCPLQDPSLADDACVARVVEELAIVQPKIVVPMGEIAVSILNGLGVPMSSPLRYVPGELQRFTPSIDALVVPDIDQCLDDEASKRRFWAAFRRLGDWYAALPPY